MLPAGRRSRRRDHCHAETRLSSPYPLLHVRLVLPAPVGKKSKGAFETAVPLVQEHLKGTCVECGLCAERCPFGVDVVANMQEAVRLFEKT